MGGKNCSSLKMKKSEKKNLEMIFFSQVDENDSETIVYLLYKLWLFCKFLRKKKECFSQRNAFFSARCALKK